VVSGNLAASPFSACHFSFAIAYGGGEFRDGK
jgi:hypothetical protein